ncbi:hypothetical protein HMPREF1144_5532 [Klebsiella sp. OBRC7]|uniref:Uncharacterized protein n=1 Tax=Raoultella ornithinolytica TaxID=54291 RepID=A0A6B7Q6U7_RAOOR|nr:hypothetical protein HMPREF1144_5532 [Klebsiella sp. OBRC7]QFX78020.1 hypothetical protein [Raoultella ornithinolytica]
MPAAEVSDRMVPFKDLLCTSFKDLNIFRLKGKPVRRLSCGQSQ